MELSRSSSVHPTTLDRIRQFFLMELPGSPSPPPEEPGVRVFRAWRYWKSNVYGAVVGSAGAVGLFTVVGGILLWQSQGWEGRLWGAGMILYAIAAVWALLGGNLAAVYPYAVEIEEGKGFRFYSPFKQFYIPTQEVKRVKWSWLWAGWVVRLERRRGLLIGFIIHFAWGRQGRELAQAIDEELTRRG
jgi:hypothetical protein